MKKIVENIINGITNVAKKVSSFVVEQVTAAINFAKKQPIKTVVYTLTGFKF